MAIVLAGVLAAITCIVVVAVPGGWWEQRLMPPRSYQAVPLGRVVADLERQGVIPLGTTWESEALKARPVTASFWFLPSASSAVNTIATAAGVVARAPWAHRCSLCGEHFAGPMHVLPAQQGRAGLERTLPAPGQYAIFKPGT